MLVTVKAYPQLSDVGESVCVAGIDLEERSWIRLYPLPFRDLPRPAQFNKYATIDVRTKKSGFDSRRESYVPDFDSISVVAPPLPAGRWTRRKKVVLPLAEEIMCEIYRRPGDERPSLGMFRPAAPPRLVIQERRRRDWSEGKQMTIDQGRMLLPEKAPLQFIPYRFKYAYSCRAEGCNGHEQTIVDWEISQAFRAWTKEKGEERALSDIRTKWEEKMWDGRETYLYTGNQLAHRRAFLVLGVFWPPASRGGTP